MRKGLLKHPKTLLARYWVRWDSANGYQKFLRIQPVLKKVLAKNDAKQENENE